MNRVERFRSIRGIDAEPRWQDPADRLKKDQVTSQVVPRTRSLLFDFIGNYESEKR